MGEFWETMNILVGSEWKKNFDDVQDWVENVVKKDDKKTLKDMELGQSFCSSTASTISTEMQIRRFWKSLNLPKIECIFTQPENRSNLEELMGSNYVSLLDRDFMQKLQKRIFQDYNDKMDNRIKNRENEEIDRQKTLVLDGKIPIKMAPEEMANHPIMLIDGFFHQKRKRKSITKIKLPLTSRSENLITPSSRLTAENKINYNSTSTNSSLSKDEVMFTIEKPEDYEEKYEDPLIVKLKECKSVEEMYNLADDIIGVMTSIETTFKSTEETVSTP